MPFLDRAVWNRVAAPWLAPRQAAERRTPYGDGTLLNQPVRSLPASLRLPEAAEGACAASGCNTSWTRAWKARRPLFDDQWGCGSRCLQTLVRQAVRRLASDRTADAGERTHRHRVPLGLVLLAQRWVTHPQLQAALEHQRRQGGGRIGDLLVEHCGLDPDRVTRGLALQWSCPVLTLEGFEPGRMALVMPQRLWAEFGLIPLRLAGSELLYLASSDHLDASVALAVEQVTGLRVECGLLSEAEMQVARRRLAEVPAIPEVYGSAIDTDDLVAQVAALLEKHQPVNSRLVRVHGQFWLRLWLEQGALPGPGRMPASPEDVQDFLFQIGPMSQPV